MKFHMLNENVCIRLKLHGEDIRKLLLKNNWQEIDKENADFIFINTCAFLKKTEDIALFNIKKIIQNKNGRQKIIVFGCLPSMNIKRLKEIIHNGIVFMRRDLEDVKKVFNLKDYKIESSHIIKRRLSRFELFNKYMNQFFFKDDYYTYLYEKEKAFHLKISEGCLGRCSFCSERFARGNLKSKKISEILKNFKDGLKQDYRIFSLNADDTSVFGMDNRENIVMLLGKILKQKKGFRMIITEFNPFGLLKYSEELIPLLSNPKIIFLTVPLQSGDVNILRKMNRPYNPLDVIEILKKIRQNNPSIKINTHIIVGFPGETEEAFRNTLSLFKTFNFNKVKVFRYNDRKGTIASRMKNKIPEDVKEKRQEEIYRQIFLNSLKKLKIKDLLLNICPFQNAIRL